MKEVTLATLTSERGPTSVAQALGCTQAAITFALRENRDIRVKLYRGGRLEAYEVRPFPSQRREKAAEDQKDAAPGEDDNAVSRQKPD